MKSLVLLLFAAFSINSCKHAQSHSLPKASPVDRKVIGAAVKYKGTRLDSALLQTSMTYRRQKAWEIVTKVVGDVPIAEDSDLGSFNPEGDKALPLWQTWYERDEFGEIFKMIYDDLGKEKRAARANFCPEKLVNILEQHAAKKLHVRFRGDRFEERLKQFVNKEQVRGVSGRGKVLFSPAVALHYLQNYQTVAQCASLATSLSRNSPPPTAENFAPCLQSEFPNDHGVNPTVPAFDASCTGNKDEQKAAWLDLGDAMGTAAIVKTSWQKVEADAEIAAFAMDRTHLLAAFQSGEWQPTRFVKSSELSADQIYTVEILNSDKSKANTRYMLTGLHILTKDLRDWMWISLVWSPEPDSDLGADRPSTLANRAPWNQYKMMVVSAYEEQIADAGKDYESTHPDLAESLRTIQTYAGSSSWGANPYIETGKGNSRTNCIGCHQHAKTGVTQDEIYRIDPKTGLGSEKYPESSRTKVRSNFPSDYLWSFYSEDIKEFLANYDEQDKHAE